MFKMNPVPSISRDMGAPFASIVLYKVIKLLMYAKCNDVVVTRAEVLRFQPELLY